MWVQLVKKLSWLVESQPQTAYIALYKSIQFEWTNHHRVIPGFLSLFCLVCNAIHNLFWPHLFGDTICEAELELFALPTRLTGLGLRDPMFSAPYAFEQVGMGQK